MALFQEPKNGRESSSNKSVSKPETKYFDRMTHI
jgi:hypothetical protein